jgi:hypothetical protein
LHPLLCSQDVEGDACIVGWDCPLWGTRGDVDELLPIATIMTIKEPKLSKTQDGYPLVGQPDSIWET